jgi:hypothetical protein
MSAPEPRTAGAQPFTRRSRGHSLVLIIAITAALVLGFSLPASGQAPSGTGTLELLRQTDWVNPGETFDIQVRPTTDIPAEQVEVVLTVFGAVRTRSQYQQSNDDKIAGTSIILDRHPLSEVLTADGSATMSLPVQDPAQKRFFLKNPGVYPLRVDLRSIDTGDVLDRFVTHILNQPQPATTPLGVTTVLPVQSPQSLDPEHPAAIDDKGASVKTVAEVLAAHPTHPLTLVAQPETLDRLPLKENDPGTGISAVDQLRAAHGSRPVLRTTWAPLSTPMYERDLSEELDRQFAAGESTLARTFPQVVSSTWAATDHLDSNALAALDQHGVDRVIVREQDISPSQRSTTLTRPFVLTAGRTKETFAAAQADSGLADHFADSDGPVLGAHRLLADLMVLWNDHPGNERNVVVMPPRSWTPNKTFLDIFLTGTTTSPVAKPTGLEELFATPVEGGSKSPLTQRLATVSKVESEGFPTSELLEQRARLTALASIATEQNEIIDGLGRHMLLAQRADLDVRGHKEWINALKNGIDDQLDGIHLPKERSIRLTAREGEIPVTVQNDNGYPVKVRVRITGNKLEFPAGDDRMIDATRQYVTERFAVVARTSGAFGVQVQLESPDGSVILQKSEITVRSTATSSVGVGLSIGAIVFLTIWWIRSTIKSRKRAAHA